MTICTEESTFESKIDNTLWTMRLGKLPDTLQSLARIRLGLNDDIQMSRHLLPQIVLQDTSLVSEFTESIVSVIWNLRLTGPVFARDQIGPRRNSLDWPMTLTELRFRVY